MTGVTTAALDYISRVFGNFVRPPGFGGLDAGREAPQTRDYFGNSSVNW